MSMKFSVEKLVAGGRLGTITNAGRHGNVSVETPICTLFTKGGSGPHLSIDMLKRIVNVPALATMNLGAFAPNYEVVQDFGKGLGEFTALKDYLIFTSLHDASAPVPTGKNDKNGVAVWGKGGKLKLDPALFVKVQEALRPDWFQAPSDGDTDHTTSKKRLRKVVDNTLDFLDTTLEILHKSEILRDACVFGAVEGGFDEEERERSAKETSTRNVDGFLIEGFEKGHSGTDLFSIPGFTSVLEKTLSHLPENKPRIMETVWSPLQVVQAFQLGVDIFSSAYPHLLAEKGLALTAHYTLKPAAPAVSRPDSDPDPSGDKGEKSPAGFSIDLNNSCYLEDFQPIMAGCPCYCCGNFSRSYIHHLLNTSELLAYVLLTIHNFHQYFDFFHHLRTAARQGTLADLQSSLENQNGSQKQSAVS